MGNVIISGFELISCLVASYCVIGTFSRAGFRKYADQAYVSLLKTAIYWYMYVYLYLIGCQRVCSERRI